MFVTIVRLGSFAEAARELGVSPAYVSKRTQILERTLATRLLHRTTRSINITADGERVYHWALQILDNMQDLFGDLAAARVTPRGQINICTSFGFGRKHVAPAVSALSDCYPELSIRLEVFDRLVDLTGEGFDLEIRVGDELPEQHISRLLAEDHRVLCASPAYLKEHGIPSSPGDLKNHQCLVLQEKNSTFGIWRLEKEGVAETVNVRGPLASNNGEIVMQWALADKGIILRSRWDAHPEIQAGRLVQVLPEYRQPANIWAVYPTRLSESAKLKACVEFMAKRFNHSAGADHMVSP